MTCITDRNYFAHEVCLRVRNILVDGGNRAWCSRAIPFRDGDGEYDAALVEDVVDALLARIEFDDRLYRSGLDGWLKVVSDLMDAKGYVDAEGTEA